MPILLAEPDMYPKNLWRGDLADLDPEGLWRCLHTKPRQEKATARYLLDRRIPYYLPQIVKEGRTPAGRKLRSVVPLFPGYIFLRGDESQRVEALKGNTLVRLLEVADQDGLERDLGQIDRMLSSGLPVTAEPACPVGTRVRIATGPLAGLVGTVLRRGKRDQFVASVQFVGRGVTVDLEDWQVDRVGA